MSCTSLSNDFNCDDRSDGARLLARLYTLQEKGQLENGAGASSIVSNIVAYGFVTASLTCEQNFIVDQTLSVSCRAGEWQTLVQQNKNCEMCLANTEQWLQDRAHLDQEAALQNPEYIPPTPTEDLFQKVNGRLPTKYDGACKYVCLQCVVRDVRQNIRMNLNANCAVNTETFFTAFTQGMTVKAREELEKEVTGLRRQGLQIAQNEDVEALALSLAATLKSITKVDTLNKLYQQALIVQQLTVQPNSTSVVIQNVSQSISLDMMTSLVSNLYTDFQVTSAIGLKAQQEFIELETSFRDLLDKLSGDGTALINLLSSIFTRIMIIVAILLMFILILFSAIFFFRPVWLFGPGK